MCNWGLAPAKSDIIVLDLDTKPGKQGRRSLDALDVLYGKLPKTSIARTPSGGLHLRYRATRTVQHTYRLNGFGTHLDCPAYTVIPGCTTPDGRYTWANDLPLVDAPDWFARELAHPRDGDKAAAPQAQVEIGEVDTADAEARARHLLHYYATTERRCNAHGNQIAGPAIEGECGEHQWNVRLLPARLATLAFPRNFAST